MSVLIEPVIRPWACDACRRTDVVPTEFDADQCEACFLQWASEAGYEPHPDGTGWWSPHPCDMGRDCDHSMLEN
jgi:hypothetical protein